MGKYGFFESISTNVIQLSVDFMVAYHLIKGECQLIVAPAYIRTADKGLIK